MSGDGSRAGGSEEIFSSEAISRLHRESDGLPRRLNRLADLALLIAFAREAERPDAETIAIAAREAAFDGLAV